MIKIEDSDKSISDIEISDFENKYKINLPTNYKKFLKKYNGGCLYEEHFYLSGFNSLKFSENNTTLESAYETYCLGNQDIDLEMLPIAYSHTDNPIVLSLKDDENQGKIYVYFMDRLGEPEVIANSLEELLGVESIDDL